MTQEQIREINRVNIINLMKAKGETTKQTIAKELSLSIPTVTQIINQLIADGYVIEAGVASSTGGRKPVILKFMKDSKYSIGVSVTPDKTELILVNLQMEELERMEFPYDEEITFEALLDQIIDVINEVLETKGLVKKQIIGVGISAPGTVDEDNLIFLNGPNIQVRNYDLKPFQDKLGIKLYIENEANVAALAEVKLGETKNVRHLVYISVTEGIGTGIVIDHQIFKSINKMAGEFGHMRISDDKKRCNCGRTGCWEIYSSKKALLARVAESIAYPVETIGEIFNDKRINQQLLENALEIYMEYLLIGIENIVLGLNPEYVVIGGELGEYETYLSPYITRSLETKSSILIDQKTKIVFSTLKSQGPLLGAALLPLQTIFSHQDSVI